MSAAGTLIEMAAERGRAATRDGPQHFHMRPGNPLALFGASFRLLNHWA